MSLFVAWVLFPAALVLLATGCGLLLRAAAGGGIPAPVIPAAGIAVIMVVTGFLTMSGATAELSTPVVLGMAIAGFVLTTEWRMPEISRWELLAALGVFAAFAAPIVLSGEATFAGYIKLDDTATWMAFTDRLMEEGRSADGLAPSTFEATIAVNLPAGYPVGAFLPIGPARELVGYDLAWLVQPYMAVMAAMLALVLAQISKSLLGSAGARAIVAFLAAQPALLFGYALWGGIKEVAAALMIALLAALSVSLVTEWSSWRRMLPLAIAAAALLATLGAGGAVWLATILAPAAVIAARADLRAFISRAAIAGGLLIVASVPMLFGSGKLFSPTQGALVNDSELGNLLGSLNPLQVVGIWPVGDFRLRPDELTLTYILVGVAVALAAIGLYAAIRRGALELGLYGAGTLAGCLLIVLVASPWVDGKALASAAPAALLLACAGAAYLWGTEARIFGAVALAVVGAGVIWSNVLGYRNVNLAPREQLAELERIGEQIAGEGPALTTDAEVYGGRHFLRKADTENSTDLRRNLVPLIDGTLADDVPSLDMDQVEPSALLAYRTLVLRRSPSHSRPPSPYRLVGSDRFYDVWQLPVSSETGLVRHLGLGDPLEPSAVPGCSDILELAAVARESGSDARLATVRRTPITVIGVQDTVHPAAWEQADLPDSLVLDSSGELSAEFTVAGPGRYTLWFGGSARGSAKAWVDGREVGSVDGQLANAQEYTDMGEVDLGPGIHRLRLRYDSEDLSPGTGTPAELPYPSMPLVLSRSDEDPRVVYVAPEDARRLCGQRLDWVEVVDR